MQTCRVITFQAGQGLFNLLIGTRNNGSLYTAVFDCGNFPEYEVTGIEEACAELNSIEGFSMLDDVVISHQDMDHWRNFMDFLLLLNGEEYSEGDWFHLQNSADGYDYVSFFENSVSKCSMEPSGNCSYLHAVYTEQGQGLFRGDHKISHGMKSSEQRLSLNIENIALRFYFYPFQGELWRVAMYQGKKSRVAAGIPFDKLHGSCIDMIGDSDIPEDGKERLYEILQGIFCSFLFGYEDVCEAVKGAKYFGKRICNLYLGGEDCEFSYSLFKKQSVLFAHNYGGAPAYLRIHADDGGKLVCADTALERDIAKPRLSGKGAVYKNATSTVAAVYVSNRECLLFPGDATVHVFGSLRNRLDRGTKVKLFLAPHHGSFDTNFSFHRNKETQEFELDDDARQPLYQLLSGYPPEYIFISAAREKFGHPSESFLRLCGRFCTGAADAHTIFCGPDDWYQGYKFKAKDVYTTEKAIFCTESSGNNLYYHYGKEKDELFIPYGGFDV